MGADAASVHGSSVHFQLFEALQLQLAYRRTDLKVSASFETGTCLFL
jgi:hypothetical protein